MKSYFLFAAISVIAVLGCSNTDTNTGTKPTTLSGEKRRGMEGSQPGTPTQFRSYYDIYDNLLNDLKDSGCMLCRF